MTHELELKLYNKHPKILRDCGKSPMESCMSFWMECDDGWYKILDECMQKLQYFCDLCTKNENKVQVVANQIKEKYGSLNFYYQVEGADEIEYSIIEDIISETERKSNNTCEISGKDGVLCSRGSWYKTLCYEESRKLNYEACNKDVEEYWKQKDKK